MKKEHRTDPLSAALGKLEAPAASPGFTAAVLHRLDERDARRRRRRIAVALAAPALLAVAVGALLMQRPGAPAVQDGSSTASVEELRQQQRLLREELELLQRVADSRRTVLYLGSSDEYDLVLDLNPLLDQRVDAPVVPALQDLRVRPARAVEAAERSQP